MDVNTRVRQTFAAEFVRGREVHDEVILVQACVSCCVIRERVIFVKATLFGSIILTVELKVENFRDMSQDEKKLNKRDMKYTKMLSRMPIFD